MKWLFFFVPILMTTAAAASNGEDVELLFDGHSVEGWEGNRMMWRIVDDAIVGGTLDGPIEVNEFLCNTQEFADFELRLEARMSSGQIGGVSFRASRVPNSTEVAGYQADMGFVPGEIMPIVSDVTEVDPDETYPLWGSLLDEYRSDASRYPDPQHPYRLVAAADRNVVDEVVRPGEWNSVSVIAIGEHIEIHLNGRKTVEYIERSDVPRTGLICLQVHYGPPSIASYRKIQIRRK